MSLLDKIRDRWGRSEIVVLMYHRIACSEWDPWDLNVSPEVFRMQMEFLANHCEPVPMNMLTTKKKKNSKPKVAISFDDGYLDNFTVALPILERYHIPATFFIPNAQLGVPSGFWWDHLAAIFLKSSHLPETGHLKIGEHLHEINVRNSSSVSIQELETLRSWKASEDTHSPRTREFMHVWKALRFQQDIDPYPVTQTLMGWAGVNLPQLPCMTEEEVRIMGAHPLFDIGGHTVNHKALSSLDAGGKDLEISRNKLALEKLIGKNICDFAAPYGDYDQETLSLLKQCGFSRAYTTEGSTTSLYRINKAPLEIARIQVTEKTNMEKLFQ
jgi:peptidoglycan/xylan/chitin deacetylase (PgdA/CDA1 family)